MVFNAGLEDILLYYLLARKKYTGVVSTLILRELGGI
jgi:hypothetical protein